MYRVQYLIDLYKPFVFYTRIISKSYRVTVQLVLPFYSLLFELLERALIKLQKKTTAQKVLLRELVEKSIKKLKKYYLKTYESYSLLYGFSILLTPILKDYQQDLKCFSDDTSEQKRKYQKELEEVQKKSYVGRGALDAPIVLPPQKKKSSLLSLTGISLERPKESAIDEFKRYKRIGILCYQHYYQRY